MCGGGGGREGLGGRKEGEERVDLQQLRKPMEEYHSSGCFPSGCPDGAGHCIYVDSSSDDEDFDDGAETGNLS